MVRKLKKKYNQIKKSKTDFVKKVSKEGLGATSTPSASGDHLPEKQENGVTSFVMPQGQNDFHHANVDQTVPFEPKDTIVERDPIVQTLPENNLTFKDIVENLKHEYKRYGEELLHKLSMFPNDFKFDKNGLISIDDNTIPGNIGKKVQIFAQFKKFSIYRVVSF